MVLTSFSTILRKVGCPQCTTMHVWLAIPIVALAHSLQGACVMACHVRNSDDRCRQKWDIQLAAQMVKTSFR